MWGTLTFVNAAHLHITLVHVPVVLAPLGAIILGWALLRSSLPVARVALCIIIAAAVIAIPAFLLGEGAEELVEHLPGLSEALIEEHEESAELSLWLTIASGLFSLITWVAVSRGVMLERALLMITLLVSTVASASLAYTAHHGGLIRHPEITDQQATSTSHTEHN